MKRLSCLFLTIGLVIIGYAAIQVFNEEIHQEKALVEAKELIEPTNISPTLETVSNKEDVATTIDYTPSVGETIGMLHIPKIESELPIIEGTNEDELKKGVGHFKGTAFPGQNEQVVLSGHRDTVFKRMGELEIGDTLTVKLPYGDFSYKIVETQIVDAEDRTIIRPQGRDVLTVTTCYPFNFIGNAPDRYIITALPIDETSNS